MSDALINTLPELLVHLRRDGTVIAWGGGSGVGPLRPAADAAGQRCEELWPASVATLLKQLARKAIAGRTAAEARFQVDGQAFEARLTAQGPDSASGIIRAILLVPREESLENTDERPRPQLDRRGFLHRFKESVALAALRETQMAIGVIHLDGIAEIGQAIAADVAERAMSVAIMRLPVHAGAQPAAGGAPAWYLGQLSESLLALVMETADRDAIEACATTICASLRQPVAVGSAEFHLTPFAGFAILGQDSSSPRSLLDQARAAASEARRSGATKPRFFTDTLQLRSLARLDIAREMRDAIASADISLRYSGRHDLSSGRLMTWVGYLRWVHPLRGEIRPVEFLRIAESTGLGTTLSRAALAALRNDFMTHGDSWDPDVRISFGPLRHHVLHKDFVDDIAEFVADGGIPAQRLELRIAEKTFVTRPPTDFDALARLGIRLVVDEVGRGMGSLDWLARASIWGLQLDRAWVTAFSRDAAALKVCSAGIAMARALGLTPIATGVEDQAVCDALLALGCQQGSGDMYHAAFPAVPACVWAAASG